MYTKRLVPLTTRKRGTQDQIVQMPWTALMLRVHWGARSIVLQELEVATMGHRMAQVSHSNHHC
jgi:hypothetical protein